MVDRPNRDSPKSKLIRTTQSKLSVKTFDLTTKRIVRKINWCVKWVKAWVNGLWVSVFVCVIIYHFTRLCLVTLAAFAFSCEFGQHIEALICLRGLCGFISLESVPTQQRVRSPYIPCCPFPDTTRKHQQTIRTTTTTTNMWWNCHSDAVTCIYISDDGLSVRTDFVQRLCENSAEFATKPKIIVSDTLEIFTYI